METLLIRPEDLTAYTPIEGNVDVNRYLPVILDVQITVIEPMLGTKLYDKVIADFKNGDLTGDYEKLYTDYLKPILRHQVAAEYIMIGAYRVANGGIMKHKSEDSDTASTKEIVFLSGTQSNKAQTYINRAVEWLSKGTIPEYKMQGCGNNNVNVTAGWDMT